MTNNLRDPNLRDLQKALAKDVKRSSDDMTWNMRQVAREIAESYNLPLRPTWKIVQEDMQVLLPLVNRLVAKHGPKALLSEIIEQHKNAAEKTAGEDRKKDTDEVHEASSMTSQNTHGGDSASGEVPDGHSTNGDADSRQVGDSLADQDSDSEGGNAGGATALEDNERGQGTVGPRSMENAVESEPTGGADQADQQVARQAKGDAQKVQGPTASEDSVAQTQQECKGETGSAKPGNEGTAAKDAYSSKAYADNEAASTDQTISGHAHTDDNDLLGDQKPAGEDGDTSEKSATQEAKRALRLLTKELGKVSRQACHSYGGITAELRKAKIAPGIVSQAHAVLASWMADGGHDEHSMRWDYPRLAARLLTRRNPYPARKDELGRPVLLILADVSGSCSGFSGEALLVAKAIASQGLPGSDVLVVAHSNGYPSECELNGKPLPPEQHKRYQVAAEQAGASYYSDGMAGNVVFYQKMVQDYDITHVIGLGDHDAVDVYAFLAEHDRVQQVIWLDNYACNQHGPRVESPHVKRVAARARICYLTGCKDASAFLAGLRVGIG